MLNQIISIIDFYQKQLTIYDFLCQLFPRMCQYDGDAFEMMEAE